MRRDFAGNRKSFGFGERDHRDRVLRRQMRHVIARAGDFGEQDIAGNHHILGTGGDAAQAEAHALESFMHVAALAQVQILAMLDHRDVEGLCVFHRAAHHAGVHDGLAIVRDRNDASLLHRTDACQFLTEAALGDRADRIHVDAVQPAGLLEDVVSDHRRVVHRVGVRHAADGSESAGGGRVDAGLDGFGMFEAGLAQVHVHVDEPRCHDEPGRVDRRNLSAQLRLRGDVLVDRDDLAVADQDVRDALRALHRVDDQAAGDQQLRVLRCQAHSSPVPVFRFGLIRPRPRAAAAPARSPCPRPRTRFRASVRPGRRAPPCGPRRRWSPGP